MPWEWAEPVRATSMAWVLCEPWPEMETVQRYLESSLVGVDWKVPPARKPEARL
jgi:hypothetical protein